ncbi:MAG: hypothetical protein WC444_06520 [Candidatus Paceibacterota bacterium]
MQVTKKKLDEVTLNKYTEDLLLCLPEHASELMHQIADDYHLPIWQIFCGIVLEVHMQGNLSNFYLEPAWAEGLKQYEYVCKHCDKKFTPVHLGQVFCSNKCGEEHTNPKVTKNDTTTKPSAPIAVATNDTPDSFAAKISELTSKAPSGWAKGDQLPID